MHIVVTVGRRIMGRLSRGEDLLAGLERRCTDWGIQLGEVRAIGAVSAARFGYYLQTDRRYTFLEVKEPQEILSLVGNISLKDGKPFVHAHVTLADGHGQAVGGHLAEGTPVFACEFVIQEYLSETLPGRRYDEETGLLLWPRGA
jgi:hypothetical protein